MYKVCESGDSMKANGFPYCVVDTEALIDDVRAFFCEFIEAQMFVEAVDGRPFCAQCGKPVIRTGNGCIHAEFDNTHIAQLSWGGLTPVVGDAASPPAGGEQSRTDGSAGEGIAPHPPRA